MGHATGPLRLEEQTEIYWVGHFGLIERNCLSVCFPLGAGGGDVCWVGVRIWDLKLVALCVSPRPGFPLMVWSMSALHWADSLSRGNHLRRSRLGRIYEMHSLVWSVYSKQASIGSGTSVVLYAAVSALVVVWVHSSPRVQSALTMTDYLISLIMWKHCLKSCEA